MSVKLLDELRLKDKRYIIFDMDGTLIDSIGVWNKTDQRLIRKFGGAHVDLDKIQNERDSFLHDNQSCDIYLAYCEHLIEKYRLKVNNAQNLLAIRWEESGEVLENEVDFKPNAADLILRLKDLGFILVLATMTTQVQLDIYSKKNKRMLKQMNIANTFNLIIKKEDVNNKKPDPEIYEKVMRHYHASPKECLIFEDSYTGVLAGKRAGIEVVNIYDKYADMDRKKINEIADYSIKDYKEICDRLRQI